MISQKCECASTCICICVSVCLGVKGTTTGHGQSQTGRARDVLTSPHALPVHSHSSSFLLKYGLYTHIQIHTDTHTHSYPYTVCMHLCTAVMHSSFLTLLPVCGSFDPRLVIFTCLSHAQMYAYSTVVFLLY